MWRSRPRLCYHRSVISLTHAVTSLIAIAAAEAETDASASPFPNFFLIVMVIAIFWFIVISPQRKEQKERDEMRENLKKGDDVVTTGGMHGQIVSIEKSTVTIRISAKTEVIFDRASVSRKIVPAPDSAGK